MTKDGAAGLGRDGPAQAARLFRAFTDTAKLVDGAQQEELGVGTALPGGGRWAWSVSSQHLGLPALWH